VQVSAQVANRYIVNHPTMHKSESHSDGGDLSPGSEKGYGPYDSGFRCSRPLKPLHPMASPPRVVRAAIKLVGAHVNVC